MLPANWCLTGDVCCFHADVGAKARLYKVLKVFFVCGDLDKLVMFLQASYSNIE